MNRGSCSVYTVQHFIVLDNEILRYGGWVVALGKEGKEERKGKENVGKGENWLGSFKSPDLGQRGGARVGLLKARGSRDCCKIWGWLVAGIALATVPIGSRRLHLTGSGGAFRTLCTTHAWLVETLRVPSCVLTVARLGLGCGFSHLEAAS